MSLQLSFAQPAYDSSCSIFETPSQTLLRLSCHRKIHKSRLRSPSTESRNLDNLGRLEFRGPGLLIPNERPVFTPTLRFGFESGNNIAVGIDRVIEALGPDSDCYPLVESVLRVSLQAGSQSPCSSRRRSAYAGVGMRRSSTDASGRCYRFHEVAPFPNSAKTTRPVAR